MAGFSNCTVPFFQLCFKFSTSPAGSGVVGSHKKFACKQNINWLPRHLVNSSDKFFANKAVEICSTSFNSSVKMKAWPRNSLDLTAWSKGSSQSNLVKLALQTGTQTQSTRNQENNVDDDRYWTQAACTRVTDGKSQAKYATLYTASRHTGTLVKY